MTRPAHILLVEDNRMDVELTLDAFHEALLSNTIHVASTGQAALDYLLGRGVYADRAAYPLPSLILLDLKLPGIDGHEVLRRDHAGMGNERGQDASAAGACPSHRPTRLPTVMRPGPECDGRSSARGFNAPASNRHSITNGQ